MVRSEISKAKLKAKIDAGIIPYISASERIAAWGRLRRERKKVEGSIININVQGLWLNCPPIPPLDKIRGSHLPQEDQVWYRDTSYEDWDWNTDPKKDVVWHHHPAEGQLEWYEAEIEKLQ